LLIPFDVIYTIQVTVFWDQRLTVWKRKQNAAFIYRTFILGMKTACSSEMLVTIIQVFRIKYTKMQDICVILSDKY